MTKHLRKIIELIANVIPYSDSILEVGSRQEKNQIKITNLRNTFTYKKYVGLDMRKGPGVDIVANAEDLPFKDKSFSLILCFETLEHSKQPWKISNEMYRVLKDHGLLIVSSQQNYPLHKHPSDYFRFTPYGLSQLFYKMRDKLIMSISPPFNNEVKLNPQLVILIGWKKPMKKMKVLIKKLLNQNLSIISGHKPYRHRLRDFLILLIRSFQEFFYKQKIIFITTDK